LAHTAASSIANRPPSTGKPDKFAKATRALPQFRGDARTSTWLHRIAANVAFDWLRGRSAREAKLTVHLAEALDEATSWPRLLTTK